MLHHHHPSLALLPPKTANTSYNAVIFSPLAAASLGGKHMGPSLKKANMHYHPHPLVGHSHKHGGMSTHMHLLQQSVSPTSQPCEPHCHAHTYPAGPTGTHIWLPRSNTTYPIPALHLCTHTPIHLPQHSSWPCVHLPCMQHPAPQMYMYTLPLAPSTYPSRG